MGRILIVYPKRLTALSALTTLLCWCLVIRCFTMNKQIGVWQGTLSVMGLLVKGTGQCGWRQQRTYYHITGDSNIFSEMMGMSNVSQIKYHL